MKNRIQFKYLPKMWASLLYIILIFGALYMYLSKYWGSTLLTSIYPDIYLHVSNFAISLIFGLIGYFWILTGVKFRMITYLSLFLVFANIVCETMLGFMNSTDVIDMYFGFAGVIFAHSALWVIFKFGIYPSERIPEN